MTEASFDTVSIPARYNGPPASSNGGYACGTVARLLGARAAEVTLRRPPPLDRPLAVERGWEGERRAAGDGGGTVRLLDGDAVVAEGRGLADLDVDQPRAVSLEAARSAAHGFPWYEGHPFPTCFVCGPRRAESDGLRLFAGAVAEGDLFACAWTPSAEWAEGGGVRTEVVWAALDCPSAVAAVALVEEGAPTAVLARLAASIEAEVRPGEPHVVVSWPVARDGRKRTSASAILGADGAVRARASALWIEVRG